MDPTQRIQLPDREAYRAKSAELNSLFHSLRHVNSDMQMAEVRTQVYRDFVHDVGNTLLGLELPIVRPTMANITRLIDNYGPRVNTTFSKLEPELGKLDPEVQDKLRTLKRGIDEMIGQLRVARACATPARAVREAGEGSVPSP